MGFLAPSLAQQPGLYPEKSKILLPVQGGEEGKNYAIIISSDLSKAELVDQTIEVLKMYELMDSSYVKSAEISDELTEFTVPLQIRFGMDFLAYLMGVKGIVQPVRLYCDVRFEFHDNGKCMIVFENFTEEGFSLVDTKNENSFSITSLDFEDADLKAYIEHMNAVMLGNLFLTKILVVLNKGIEALREWENSMNDYLSNINNEYDIYRKVEAKGYGKWLSDSQVVEYLSNTKGPGMKYQYDMAKIYYDQHRLLYINERRWQEKVRPYMDLFFKSIVVALGASVEGLAEDGEETWIKKDGLVVPVDPKEQKKYLRNKQSY
jgi:hypothetical protein